MTQRAKLVIDQPPDGFERRACVSTLREEVELAINVSNEWVDGEMDFFSKLELGFLSTPE